MKLKKLLLMLLLIIAFSTKAQITTDGTLGPQLNLPGPDYEINSNLGQQLGGNLFHSFQDFNLQSHESATFSGPDNVNNVISRVTGGNPSHIDGLLRSTMPNADFYFLNPYGLMFGSNAKLDLQGSFHVSTADYLRLEEGGRFDARQPNNSLLTIAPISAFGFLTDTPAAITTQDSNLSVPENQTFSLIGGELRLNGESPIQFDPKNFAATYARAKLTAMAGRINLASVASKGEVVPREFGLDLNGEGGKIRADKTLIEVSGQGGGEVFIRGGQLVMENATIQANTQSDLNAKSIDMRLTESIKIRGDLLAVLTDTYGSGDAGHLVIITPHLEVTGSTLKTSSFGQGNSGKIDIEAQQVYLKKGGRIENSTFVTGEGGYTNIKAEEVVDISGWRDGNMIINGLNYIHYASEISNTTRGLGNAASLNIVTKHLALNGGGIATDSIGLNNIQTGNAGDITINAQTANLTEGAMIFTLLRGNGKKGGNINLIITDTLSLTGQRLTPFISPLGNDFGKMPTIISSSAFLDNQPGSQGGDIFISATRLVINDGAIVAASTLDKARAGNITIKTNDLYLTQGGMIASTNFVLVTSDFTSDLIFAPVTSESQIVGSGESGIINITATGDMAISGQRNSGFPSGILTNTASSGQGGDIEIHANKLTLTNSGIISAISQSTGNAGQIAVQANTINLTNNGIISTEAKNAAGGNITITTPTLLYLYEGDLTTSVSMGKGQGGDITITNPTFVVLEQGQIKAQADEGQGGNIRIVAEQFLASPDSLVSASSRLGIDGNVSIESPDIDMNAFLVVLPGGYMETRLPIGCQIQDVEELSRFRIAIEPDGMPRTPMSFPD